MSASCRTYNFRRSDATFSLAASHDARQLAVLFPTRKGKQRKGKERKAGKRGSDSFPSSILRSAGGVADRDKTTRASDTRQFICTSSKNFFLRRPHRFYTTFPIFFREQTLPAAREFIRLFLVDLNAAALARRADPGDYDARGRFMRRFPGR